MEEKAYDSPENTQLGQHHPKKDGEHSYEEVNTGQFQLNDDSYAQQPRFVEVYVDMMIDVEYQKFVKTG